MIWVCREEIYFSRRGWTCETSHRFTDLPRRAEDEITAVLLGAERYRPRIQAALEATIHRHVEIEKVHLNLFTGPGFTLDNVLIADTQAAGIEPFAHVNRLQARVKLSSLLGGRLAFSNLELSEPTVNLVRPEDAPWNVSPALSERALSASD